mmetsp:Transcript_78258/g.203988  ORF Transcript_78258/g.203988 Transcript_78258/m.203988 type:complete len:225 (+) Transcript_78258:181-855(+)
MCRASTSGSAWASWGTQKASACSTQAWWGSSPCSPCQRQEPPPRSPPPWLRLASPRQPPAQPSSCSTATSTQRRSGAHSAVGCGSGWPRRPSARQSHRSTCPTPPCATCTPPGRDPPSLPRRRASTARSSWAPWGIRRASSCSTQPASAHSRRPQPEQGQGPGIASAWGPPLRLAERFSSCSRAISRKQRQSCRAEQRSRRAGRGRPVPKLASLDLATVVQRRY